MSCLRSTSAVSWGVTLAIAIFGQPMPAETPPNPEASGRVDAAVDAAVDTAAKALVPPGPRAASADTPPKDSTDAITDTVKDTVKEAIKGAMDGTLRDKVQEKLKDALTDPPGDAAADGPMETKIVLRVSREFIRRHAPPASEQAAPIDRCLFGSHVTGTAITRGRPAVEFDTDHSKPVFILHFKGTTTSRTVATKHPVQAYSTGRTTFDVHREIRFDGLQFSEGPEMIEASHSSRLDGLATPPGLRGCIVRRLALPQIEKTRPQAEAIALRETKATILEAFGKHTDKLIDDLNANVPWKQTLALLMPQKTDWSGHFSSTKDWLLASPGPKDAKLPQLPEEAESMQAPIELWVHGRPTVDTAAKVVALWQSVHGAMDRFREPSSPRAHEIVEAFKPSMVGEWWVVHVGADLLESLIDDLDDNQRN